MIEIPMRHRYRIILFAILLLWNAGIFIEWLIKYNEDLLMGVPFLQETYGLVCHQQKAKLISFDHFETLTCTRCTGIYMGLLFSSAIILLRFPRKIPNIKFLLAAAVPMFADVILYSMNIYHYSKLTAFITGLLLGSVGFLYLYAGLNNLIRELKR